MERKLSARPDGLFSKINLSRVLTTARDVLTSDEEKTISAALAALDEASKLLNDFLKEDWVSYQNKLANKQISLDTVIK